MNFKIGETSAQWAELAKLDYWYEPTTTSTNLIAKESAFSNEVIESPIAVYFTDHQSLGRGRGTNKWLDTREGGAFLTSWSFGTNQVPPYLLTCAFGLAVYKALSATWPSLPFSLKIPNDIFLGSQKLGGLLVEAVSEGDQHRVILGLGINVFSYPTVLDGATCIAHHLQQQNIPLTEEIWTSFLDRLFLELSLAMTYRKSFVALEKKSYLYALNRRPNIDRTFLDLDEQGNISTTLGLIQWNEN